MCNLEDFQAHISTTDGFSHLNQLQSLQSNTATQRKTIFDNGMSYITPDMLYVDELICKHKKRVKKVDNE